MTPESRTANFYNSVGWKDAGGVTEDARRFEDLRPGAADYVSRCRRRTMNHIPMAGDRLLDMASGPIQYPEYLDYSAGYVRRTCVDFSAAALVEAERKIGGHGEFMCGDFFDLPFTRDSFAAAVSLHTIYHIGAERQEEAVRKLLRITRGPVVIVYSNPRSLALMLTAPLRWLKRRLRGSAPATGLYFHAHPLGWWDRFGDVATVEIHPWRSLSAPFQRLVPCWLLPLLFRLEETFPRLAARFGQYPMIVLTRR